MEMNRDKSQTPDPHAAETSSSPSKPEGLPRLLPDLSCDCHLHILGPESQYRFSEERQYTPMDARVPEAMAMLNGLGCTRAVIVQPSVYGVDNSCTIDAMEEFPIQTRSVIVIPADLPPTELAGLHEKGVRGIRLNGTQWSVENLVDCFSAHRAQFEMMQDLNWHIECFIGAHTHSVLPRLADSSNLDLVLDHFGGPLGQNETIENRITVLDQLLGSGRIWLKISGYYRLKTGEKEPTPFARLIEYLLKYHSHRLIWGSDWPHTPDRQDRQKFRNTPLPFQNIDIYGSMAFLLNYIEDQKVIDRIFIKNPETIYQF